MSNERKLQNDNSNLLENLSIAFSSACTSIEDSSVFSRKQTNSNDCPGEM